VAALEGGSFGFSNTNVTHIVKDRAGGLAIQYSGNGFGGMVCSQNGGSTWTTRASPWENHLLDGPFSQLLPGNAADPHDLWMVYGDQSAGEISLKVYDDSMDQWSETLITNEVTLSTGGLRQTAASIRHSDGHMILGV